MIIGITIDILHFIDLITIFYIIYSLIVIDSLIIF